jgi:hypothetical protein
MRHWVMLSVVEDASNMPSPGPDPGHVLLGHGLGTVPKTRPKKTMGHWVMPSVVEDASRMAERLARALTSSGYRADFSPSSLWEIDRFFDEQTVRASPAAVDCSQIKPGRVYSRSVHTRAREFIGRSAGSGPPTMLIPKPRSTSSSVWQTEASSGLFSGS